MRSIQDLTELHSLISQEVAVSDWITITQDRIDTFAEATGDHQWIHVDPERCQRDSPFGCTIAHGYLTLSLIPVMMQSALQISDARMQINYGLNKLRFPAPVPVNSKLRARLTLSAVDQIPQGTQVQWQVVVEREGGDKAVCVAEVIVRQV